MAKENMLSGLDIQDTEMPPKIEAMGDYNRQAKALDTPTLYQQTMRHFMLAARHTKDRNYAAAQAKITRAAIYLANLEQRAEPGFPDNP